MATQWTAQGISSGAVLTAATLQSIGAAWETWSPTLSTWTLGNGTLTGRYTRINKFVNVEITLTIGSTSNTAGLGPIINLPITPRTGNIGLFSWFGTASDASAGTQYPMSAWPVGGSSFYPVTLGSAGAYVNSYYTSSTTPMTWATGDYLYLQGIYEAS